MQADTLSGWLKAFAALHARAKQGELSADEKLEYAKSRDELAEGLLLAQQITPHGSSGQRRRALRVAQALQVQLESDLYSATAITLDLSSGGFSTIISRGFDVGTQMTFTLKLGRGREPVHGSAKVVNAMPQNGSVRIGVAFVEMAAADRERLDFVIVDAVLKQFGY
jgi:c-di-GMP-binding flagellar brake protein YcgR